MARSTEWMRWFDRTCGGAVLHAITIGRRTRTKVLPDWPRKIGIILPTGIGDAILSSGLYTAVQDRFPLAELVVFHHPNTASAIRLVPLKMTLIECAMTKPIAMVKRLRQERLDVVIDLWTWPRSTAIFARLGAPVTVGFATARHAREAAFDIAVPHLPDVHERSNYQAMAAVFSKKPYQLNIRTEPFRSCQLIPQRLVLCHICAGGSRAADKAWPDEHWVQLIKALAVAGWQIGFTGTTEDAHRIQTILDAAALPPTQAQSLCGLLPLAQLGCLLRQVRLLVTIDTGVLHLAAAVNAKVLTIHGPTRSVCWGAFNTDATNLDSNHPAAGYIRYGYETHPLGHQTMRAHTADAVTRAVFVKLNE